MRKGGREEGRGGERMHACGSIIPTQPSRDAIGLDREPGSVPP